MSDFVTTLNCKIQPEADCIPVWTHLTRNCPMLDQSQFPSPQFGLVCGKLLWKETEGALSDLIDCHTKSIVTLARNLSFIFL